VLLVMCDDYRVDAGRFILAVFVVFKAKYLIKGKSQESTSFYDN